MRLKSFMLHKFQLVSILCWGVGISFLFGFSGACSPEQYKAQADKEVYEIIDDKWQDNFGQKSNYLINDSNIPPAPNDIRIEKAVPASGIISLPQAIALATAYNRDYQRQKEQLYLMALDLTNTRHQWERKWFGTIDGTYNRNSDDEIVSSEADLGFNQLLADGAQISTGIALDWARFLTGDPSTSLGTVLSASVTQPLLRGRGRKIAQENLTQAERNVLYQIRSFNRYRKTFVVSIVNDYYRVLQLKDAVANAQNSYQSKVESKKRLEMEAETGRKTRLDVDEAEQSMLRAESSYVSAQERYKTQLDQFKIRLSLPTDIEVSLDPNELEALRGAGIKEIDYPLDKAVETAISQRLDLANSRDEVDDSTRKVMVAADNLGVELNLVGSARVNSTAETDYSRLQFHRGNYTLGLEADLPLDRVSERNAYRESLLAFEQRQREYQNDVDEIKLAVRQAYRQLKEEAESYRIAKMGLDLAERRVESNKLLLDAGRVTVRILLDAQDALLLAQNDFTSAIVGHTIAKLNFFRDVGILDVRPDGMWEQRVE